MNLILPTFTAKSIFDIDVNFYKLLNIKFILTDLDNTLDSFRCKFPSERTINFVKCLKKNNIKLIICSNNNNKRVSKYAKILGVDYISNCGKPRINKILNYLHKRNISSSQIVFIGDQLLTDIKCGMKLNSRTIYTEEIVKENGFFTKINKKIEKKYKLKLKNENLNLDWRNYYVNSKES